MRIPALCVRVNDAFPDQTYRKTLMLLEMSPKGKLWEKPKLSKRLLKLTQNQKA